ncbi:MAG TPA: nitrite reductase large subunit NirB, partial [Polyangiaceae bacterium]
MPGSSDFDVLARLFRQEGAGVHRFSIDSAEPSARPLESWIIELFEGEFDDVVFFTAQAVRLIVEFARQLDREAEAIAALRTARKIAVGPKVAAALREIGLRGDVVSANSSAESLLSSFENLDVEGRVVGLATLTPDPRIAERLETRRATVRLLSRTNAADAAAVELFELVLGSGVDALIFTSSAQVERVWDVACVRGKTSDLRAALAKLRVTWLGSATELALRQHGIVPALELSRAVCVRPHIDDIAPVVERRSDDQGALSEPPPRTPGVRGKHQEVVIIGNGMVGWKLCERLTELDASGALRISTFCEEPRPAYDRVNLTSYLEKSGEDELALAPLDWYRQRKIRLLLGERAMRIHRKQKAVQSSSGEWIPYDVLVLATGSVPFLPPIPGVDKEGVFVYRTTEDLDRIREHASRSKRAVVLGGGLLGLEAAKAVKNLGLDTEVVEFAPRLMPRQLDAAGARLLTRSIRALGIGVHLGRGAQRIVGNARVEGVEFADGEALPCDLVVVAAGIRPRDELARQAGLELGDRGGIVIDDELRTSDSSIFAVGECVLHRGVVYGLVAPGYEMASALARTLTGDATKFAGADQSSKLKLLGVDVASFGDPFSDTTGGSSITYEDLVKGVYKKLVISEDRTRLLGGVLVGDTSDYSKLTQYVRTGQPLPDAPEELVLGVRDGQSAAGSMGESAQVCSCNNVTKRDICHAIRRGECGSVADIRQKTRAGSGCGGCLPLVADLLKAELKATGQVVREHLCEHFAFSRQELYEIVKVKRHRTFDELLKTHGSGNGCEICKPAVASILASLHNEMILADEHATLQDTNDRFLANLQRTGLYSVVPRVPGGEITPEKLIRLGEIAKKFGLY